MSVAVAPGLWQSLTRRVRVDVLVSAVVFVILAVLLLWRLTSNTLAGDLFEHAAAVRELATHPTDPANPLLLLDVPHTLYSPYSLLVALLVRVSGGDSFTTLGLVGLVNAAVLLLAFGVFVGRFTTSPPAIALALVFAIVAWGSSSIPGLADPLIWSGFLNLNSLSYGLPYPSTVALGAAFIVIALLQRVLHGGRVGWLVVVALLQALIVVMHPYTALFVVVAAGAFVVAESPAPIGRTLLSRRNTAVAAAVVAGIVLALAWPYYPVLALLIGQVGSFDDEQRAMYSQVLPRLGPALLGGPFVLWRLRERPRDALAWLIIGLSVIYLAGYATRHYTLGRVLPFIALGLQIALAIGTTRLLAAWPSTSRGNSGPRTTGRLAGAAVAAATVAFSGLSLASVLNTAESHADVMTVAMRTGQYDVAIAEGIANYEIPPWGAKVVDWGGSVAFVPDLERRRQDVAAFFSNGTSDDQRRAILARYGVTWIVYDVQSPSLDPAVPAQLQRIASITTMSADGRVVLMRTAP